MIDEWRGVSQCPNYTVSNRGVVRGPRGILKPQIDRYGYRRVWIKREDGKRQFVCVHALVLAAFVGPRPPKAEGRHLDGDKANNGLANLSYGTPRENRQDSIRHGTIAYGERHGSAKLDDEAVAAIRLAASAGAKKRHLAKQYGVDPNTIRRALSGDNWKHLGDLRRAAAVLAELESP